MTDLNANVMSLTGQGLDDLYQALLSKEGEVLEERRRREALPFVWAAEESTVASIRAALSKPARIGQDHDVPAWVKPETIMDAYINGDRVTHGGDTWTANAEGALYVAPGTLDPIRGQVWVSQSDSVPAEVIDAA